VLRKSRRLVSRADVDLQWLNRDGAEAGTTTLLQDAVRVVELPEDEEDIYVWAGCEFNAFRSIRTYMRKERNVAKDRQLIVAYWRRGQDGDTCRARHPTIDAMKKGTGRSPLFFACLYPRSLRWPASGSSYSRHGYCR
jgi:hypothetical protein